MCVNCKCLKTSDFVFHLPETFCWQNTRSEHRDEARLMVLDRHKTIEHKLFKDVIPIILNEDDYLSLTIQKFSLQDCKGNKKNWC